MSDTSIGLSREEILTDFKLALLSREIALLARREVLSGKAKFGIFGDGKEVAQLSLIHISEPTRPAPLSRMPSSA